MSSGMANRPNANGKPQWVLAFGWGGGTGLRVKNCPSAGFGSCSFDTIGKLLIGRLGVQSQRFTLDGERWLLLVLVGGR
jgi:hypothetical protein